jgi:putative membrane protein
MSNPPSERRLHPISFLFELASHMRQLLVPGLFVLIAGARGNDRWQVYGMLFLVPVALVSIARALVFRYEFAPDELVIRSGLLFKQQRHIPYTRIQNLDAIQTVFHRALGVFDVRLETAGGEEPEAHLKVVSAPAFEELRERVQLGKSRSPAAAAEVPEGPPAAPLLELSTRDLVLCGLIQGRGLIVIGALFGLVWEAGIFDRLTGWMFGDALEGRGVVRQLLRGTIGQGIPSPGRIALTAAAFALLIAVTRLFSVGWALVRLHGFTLRKAGDDLRVDFGLFTRVAAAVPIRKIQSVTIFEGPLHRLFRRVSIHVDTAGGGTGEEVQLQRQWLAPVIPPADAISLVERIVAGAALDSVDWQPVDPRGVRRARFEWLVVAAGAALLLVALLRWWTPAAFLALAAIGELNARKSVRALGWRVGETAVFFRSGWLWRRRTVAPLAKIQVVSLRESPFDRRMRMASVGVDTAGTAEGGQRIHVPYLSRSVADRLAADLAAEAGRTRFRW